MADYIIPTPRNPILGLLADAMMGGLAYMEDPRRTQQMRGVGGLLSDTGIAQTVERLASGEPLTKGKGFATRMKPETAAAAMTLAPEAVPIGRAATAAVRATKGLPVGASIRKAGKEINVGMNEAGNFLSARSEFGQVGGLIRPPDSISDKPYLRINYAEVEESQRGKGHGKGLYEALIKEANERGLRVFSDYTVEKPAVNVYKSLGRSGYDITDMSAGTLDDGSVYGIGANRPAFEIRPKSTNTISAPQNAALRLAQQRAALPVSEGGLGLPPNNTPMDRARAMGFESGWAHGSPRSDITELRSSRIGAQGPGAYATNYLPEASTYSGTGEGATVYPLMVRKSEAINTKFNNPYDELGVNADDALLSELFGRGKSAIVTTQEKTPDWLLRAGAPDMPERQHFVSVRPENFRSRFAAFDPTRRNEPDLLAGALPFTALLDEENRARLEEQLSGLLGR